MRRIGQVAIALAPIPWGWNDRIGGIRYYDWRYDGFRFALPILRNYYEITKLRSFSWPNVA